MRSIFSVFVFIVITNISWAQWDCRSILGAHLHPVFGKKTPFYAGIEGTVGHGYMTDRQITNIMAFAGMEYRIKSKHSFYSEFGFKGWNFVSLNDPINKENNTDKFQKKSLGLREGFYRYNGENTTLTAGFQSITAGDLWLVSERALGLKLSKSWNTQGIDFAAASVVRDFSRMGGYCTVKYLYNLVKHRPDAYIGEELGETNFASVVWWFNPSASKPTTSTENANDEFKPIENSDDEFKPVENKSEISGEDEFKSTSSEESNSSVEKVPFFKFSKHGLILYSEFGSKIPDLRFWPGYMLNIELEKKINVKAEALYQIHDKNQAVLTMAGINYNYTWASSHNTQLSFNGYYHFEVDKDAIASPSFTNFFIGEVLRMEAQDIPILQTYVKHTFPGKIKFYAKAQYVNQLLNNSMQEADIELGAKLFKRFRLTAIYSNITAKTLNKPYNMIRLELRMSI